MAQYDNEHIVVYQAYPTNLGSFAVKHGYFGGDFNLHRMSWIKPSFLWMMHRSSWGTKKGQEVVLAIWIKRSSFEYILEQAIHSSFIPSMYETIEAWRKAINNSSVRLQWDPDYDPSDRKIERRAIQLGLSGEILVQYAQGGWIVHIEDITEFAHVQREYAKSGNYNQLLIPRETIYMVSKAEVGERLQLSSLQSNEDSCTKN